MADSDDKEALLLQQLRSAAEANLDKQSADKIALVESADLVFEPDEYENIPEMLKFWALTKNLVVIEDHVDRRGITRTVAKRLSIKERLDAGKLASDFFHPRLKSIETKSITDMEGLTDEDLQRELEEYFGTVQQKPVRKKSPKKKTVDDE